MNATDRKTSDSQVRFLEAYEKHGSILKAGKATNISRETVRLWRRADKFGFAERFNDSAATFFEEVESVFFERVKQSDCDPRLVALFLRSHAPDKYGEVKVVADTTAQETLHLLKEAAKRNPRSPEPEGDAATAEARFLATLPKPGAG